MEFTHKQRGYGRVLLVFFVLTLNIVIAGYAYRFHAQEVSIVNMRHNEVMNTLLAEEALLKGSLMRTDGVATWEETAYAKQHTARK